jgi:hypothetical protein
MVAGAADVSAQPRPQVPPLVASTVVWSSGMLFRVSTRFCNFLAACAGWRGVRGVLRVSDKAVCCSAVYGS